MRSIVSLQSGQVNFSLFITKATGCSEYFGQCGQETGISKTRPNSSLGMTHPRPMHSPVIILPGTFGSSFDYTDIEQPVLYTHGIRSWLIETRISDQQLMTGRLHQRRIPSDPWQRTRMRLWSKMVDEGLFEGVTELSFSAMFRERMRNMPEEIRERRFRNVGDPRRRERFMSIYESCASPPTARGCGL